VPTRSYTALPYTPGRTFLRTRTREKVPHLLRRGLTWMFPPPGVNTASLVRVFETYGPLATANIWVSNPGETDY
jgi:hypothetical protein